MDEPSFDPLEEQPSKGYPATVDKLRVGECAIAAFASLKENDFLSAAYQFDHAKIACLLLGELYGLTQDAQRFEDSPTRRSLAALTGEGE